MEKLYKKFRPILLLGVSLTAVCAFATASFADKVTLFIRGTGIVRDGAGISATEGSTILLYHQVAGRDPLAASGIPAGDDTALVLEEPGSTGTPISPALQISSGNIQTAAGANGDRYVQVDVSPGEIIYARLWAPAAGLNNNYNVVSYSFPARPAFDTLTNPTWDWTGLNVRYRASAPPVPVVNRAGIEESLERDGETANYSVSLTIPVTPGTGYDVESVTYRTKVWRDDVGGRGDPGESAPASPDVRVLDNGSTSFNFRNGVSPWNNYFQGGASYHAMARAYNVFGTSAWSPDINPLWTTGGTGGAVTPFDKTWNLVRPTTGINTISVPFNASRGITNADGSIIVVASGWILTVNALIAEINRQAGASVVTVFGWYDEVNQRHVGLTSVAGGTVTGAANAAAILAMPVVQDHPYQVSVSAPVEFTLRGFRQ